LIFIANSINRDPLLLGLAAPARRWCVDRRTDRRAAVRQDRPAHHVPGDQILFIILALAQAFVTSIGMLIVIRFLLGVR